MTLKEFALKINEKIQRARAKKDEAHNQSTALFNFMPSFIAQPMLWCFSYLALAVGFNIPPLALRNDSFGHLILTNIGTLGLTSGYAPLCPPCHHMGIFCVGKIEKKPIVNEQGEIVVGDVSHIVGTGDHRFGDAIIWKPLFCALRGYMQGPDTFDPTDLKKYPENPHYTEKDEKAKVE